MKMAASMEEAGTSPEMNTVKFSHPLHAKSVLIALSESRKNPNLCDGIVIIEDKEIPVQRNVLAAASPYFR